PALLQHRPAHAGGRAGGRDPHRLLVPCGATPHPDRAGESSSEVVDSPDAPPRAALAGRAPAHPPLVCPRGHRVRHRARRRASATAVNLTLGDLGRPQRSQEEIFSFVGDGIKRLLRLAVGQENQPRYEEALRIFRGHYLAHCLDRTRFYPGVETVLNHFAHTLKAVATNKSLEYTTRILQGLGAHHFAYVVGGDDGYGLKPDPAMFLKILDELNVAKERAVLIGDSTNDIN